MAVGVATLVGIGVLVGVKVATATFVGSTPPLAV